MAESFTPTGGASISFTSQIHGSSGPLPVRAAFVSVRHVPWSNSTVVDLGGLGELRITAELLFATETVYNNLKAQQAASGTLIYAGTTYTSTVLVKLDSPRKLYPSNKVLASSEWVSIA